MNGITEIELDNSHEEPRLVVTGDMETLRGLAAGPEEPKWLVWSNQKGMWWRADHTGYTQFIEEAGRYTRDEAAKIVAQATCDGKLQHHRVDPYTGVEYIGVDEVMVQAP